MTKNQVKFVIDPKMINQTIFKSCQNVYQKYIHHTYDSFFP